ncbi:MAG: hypothetical protein KDC87_02595, partial [Planctomycetes bacterium]|nr:hypothetical protein [Planctomycetota bacterium]
MKLCLRPLSGVLALVTLLVSPLVAQDMSAPGGADHGRGEIVGLPPQVAGTPPVDPVPFGVGPVQVDPFYRVSEASKQLDPGDVLDLSVTRSFQGITDTGWFP